MRQKISLRKVALILTFAGLIGGGTFFYFNLGDTEEAKAAAGMETIAAGSYVIDMGITPQTTSNGLRPYGLIYDLITNNLVPVKWVINPSKARDGNDFSHNGFNYKGGPFIITKDYITPAVLAKIIQWQDSGVVGRFTTSSISVPVYETLTSFPTIMIDSLSSLQNIIVNYYNNARIPATAYTIGTPANLSQCYDLWCNPHGDPTWATHNPLYNFVTVQKSWIWAQCHSVSMMEYCQTNTPTFRQLNFLTSNGLRCWKNAGCGTNPESHVKSAVAPISYFYPSDPVMQFIGNMHGVCTAGSEQFFQPMSTGRWNATTRRGVTTSNGTAPREGALIMYGPAYGNAANGQVCYVGGHDMTGAGTATEQVAAQRSYMNFMLLAGKARSLNVTATLPPSTMDPATSAPVAAQTLTGTPPFTYEWSSQIGGSFGNPTDSSTYYISPSYPMDTVDIVRVKVTDLCGRVNFISIAVRIPNYLTLPVTLVSFNAYPQPDRVDLKWVTASEINNDYFTLERSADAINWQKIHKTSGAGNSTQMNYYSWSDREALNGTSYYRLSQTDFDGQTEYFQVVVVRRSSAVNPVGVDLLRVDNTLFTESFSFNFESEVPGNGELRIYSINGQLEDTRRYKIEKGRQVFFYDQHRLMTGVHIAVFQTNSGAVYKTKVIKI